MFRVHMKPTPPHNFREAFNTPEENARLRPCSITCSTPAS
jgi:hypothetical protein